MNTNNDTTATYYGKRVIITDTERRPGGIVAYVRRDPAETNWPWTVDSFSVPLDSLARAAQKAVK